MTEKEKLLQNMMYDPSDEILANERNTAKKLIREFNNTDRDDKRYIEILQKLLGKMGKDAWIESPFFCDYGYNIEVGDNFYANTNFTALDCGKIKIGNNVMIGPNVSILTPVHPTNAKERATLKEYSKNVKIEDDVWIAGNVTIIGGVNIGKGSIVAAGSVVVKDVPPNVMVAGNPCKVIKEIN